MKYLLLLFLTALNLVSCGQSKSPAETDSDLYQQLIGIDAANISSSTQDTIRLGQMKQGEVLEYNFGITNTDSTAMVILDIQKTCGCTVLEFSKQPVLPGETTLVRLRFNSKGLIGPQMKLIRVVTSLHEDPYIIRIMGNVSV